MERKRLNWIKAMVVDDSQAILDYVSVLLRDEFDINHCYGFQDAESALTKLKNLNETNLILLDLNMPGLDGIQFLKELTKLNYKGFLVIMSGVAPRIISTVEELAKRHKLNYLGALLKPLDISDFYKILYRIGEPAATKAEQRSLKIYEIIRAIKNDQLEVRYQPLISLHDNSLYGVEALIRLNHPNLGLVSPQRFLSKVEQSELMTHITEAMLDKAFRDWHKWRKQGLEISLSVNVCPYTLQQESFVDDLFELIERHDIPPKNLCVEVTESVIAADLKQELETLSRLNMRGVRVALDDFGQDHASIDRLQHLPINILKLDKSFFVETKNAHGQISMIESCVALAKRLHVVTIAEGIEEAQHWKLASELGCDIAQGYYLSKPIQAKELFAWMEGWKSQID